MAAMLLRGAAATALSAALAYLHFRTYRPAAHGITAWHAETRRRSRELTPVDHIFRPVARHEIKSDRFTLWTSAAKDYEPLRNLPFTPVLSCEPGESRLMDRFDWQLVPSSAWEAVEADASQKAGALTCNFVDNRPWRNMSGRMRDPRTVWAAPHAISKLLELAERDFDPSHSRRAVVFSGTEMPMSWAFGHTHEHRMDIVRRLRKYFSVIKYMTKDIKLEHVGVAPMGLCWGYFITHMDSWVRLDDMNSKRPVADRYRTLEETINNSVHSKTKSILAVRGVWASWLELDATAERALAYKRKGVLWPVTNTSTKAIFWAVKSRQSLRAWAETPEAQSNGVDLRILNTTEWWQELPKYRFLMNPLGSAIQTAKTIEALLVLTVPIIKVTVWDAPRELKAMGFPLVLINEWNEVTAEAADRWWRELSPRLESFRRNCLTVDGYWRMFIGAVRVCE